jgi:hypothetical protein
MSRRVSGAFGAVPRVGRRQGTQPGKGVYQEFQAYLRARDDSDPSGLDGAPARVTEYLGVVMQAMRIPVEEQEASTEARE